MLRLVIIFATVLSLSGCSIMTLVENKRQPAGVIYNVDPQINWNSFKDGSIETWTIDGPLLQAVRFINAVADNESIYPTQNSKQKLPVFHSNMTATEIQEIVVDTWSALGAAGVESENLRPVTIGSLDGFRFEMKFLSGDGLEQDGLVVGMVSKEKLYLLMYTGDRSYYYSKYVRQVEDMILSIQTTI